MFLCEFEPAGVTDTGDKELEFLNDVQGQSFADEIEPKVEHFFLHNFYVK